MTSQDPYETLRAKFPNLYGDIPFECGPGWYNILLDLSHKIMEHIKDYPDHMHKYGETRSLVSQIKEKYGTLRYYVYETCDDIYEMIEEAEELSSHTCEACGKTGAELRGSGLVVTRCEKCWQSHYDKLD